MSMVRRFLLVFVLCVLAVAYLYQHSYSVKLTRNLSRLETQRQLLAEQLEGVDAEIVRLSAFARLDSIWVAQGRPTSPGEEMVGAERQMVAVARQPGTDASAH
jgi:hypothetical protein